jgi:adenylate kinase
VAEDTDLGRAVKDHLEAGELVPDDTVVTIIRDRVRGGSRCFVLDGFPRNVAQAEALDGILAEVGAPLDAVLQFVLDRRTLLERVAGRGRDDDRPEIVARRLDVYDAQTKPLVEHYRARGLLREIDGRGTPDEVHAEIIATLPSPKPGC